MKTKEGNMHKMNKLNEYKLSEESNHSNLLPIEKTNNLRLNMRN